MAKQKEKPEQLIDLNLDEIFVMDLNGVKNMLAGLGKPIGNLIFTRAVSVPVHDKGRQLHETSKASVTYDELYEMANILTSPANRMFGVLHQEAVNKYFVDKLKKDNEREKA